MAGQTDSSAPPGESTDSAIEATNASAAETSQTPVQPGQPAEKREPQAETEAPPTNTTQPEASQPATSTSQNAAGSSRSPEETGHSAPAPVTTSAGTGTSLPAVDSSIPAMDKSQYMMESGLPSFDSSLHSASSSAPNLSLPAIEATLTTLDASLPAIGTDIPTMDAGHSFNDESQPALDNHQSNAASANSTRPHAAPGNNAPQSQGYLDGSGRYQATPNGTYQYAQGQTQPQQQYQQSPNMYHNPGGFTATNVNSDGSAQEQPGQMPQAPIGSPLPSNMPPMASMGQYMAGYPSNVPQPGMNPNAQMHYHPGDPNKMLSGERHKKEVKRRTKTGCLTCRKRRIKCDEGHPVCRNCVKSKRECLGYDPVFRPQATSSPSAIQPAPNPPPSLVVNPQSLSSSPSSSYPSAPPGYVPATSQPFTPSITSESHNTHIDQHQPGTTIDPSLGAANSTSVANMQNSGEPRPQGSEPTYKPKNLQVNDLIALRGIASPPPHPVGTLPPGRLEEIQAVFLATYAPAIDKLLEIRWYSEKALSALMADQQLMADYSALINAFNEWNLADGEMLARLESFEASIIWRSMVLCRQASNTENGQYDRDWNLVVANARLDAIEALLTWKHLESNTLSRVLEMEAATPPNPPDQFMQRQLDFWSEMGEFLTLHDNEASSAKEIDDTLARCRQLLDTYENRDIIYSIAVARHLGQRWADFPNSLPEVGYTDEKEAGTKLYVAQKFLEEEAEGKGTTQIYKRICCMAVRSWWISRE